MTVTAFADACWRLDHWSGAVAGTDNPAVVELNRYSGNTSITAHFEVSPLIEADYDCDGDVDGSDLAALVARGAAITPEQVQAMAANLGATD